MQKLELNKIYNMSFQDFDKAHNCEPVFDFVFADPPYNMQLGNKNLKRPDGSSVNGINDDWDSFTSYQEYDNFTTEYLSFIEKWTTKTASIFICGMYHNIHRIGKLCQDRGWWTQNEITWVKTNPTPNFLGTRFCNSTETILWMTKSEKAKPLFNYQLMKTLNGGKQMRSDWSISVCSGHARLKDSEGKSLHRTQKPEKLIELCMLATTKEQFNVLDLFSGTGTTSAVAVQLGRNYIGIEPKEEYVEAANDRLAKLRKSDN